MNFLSTLMSTLLLVHILLSPPSTTATFDPLIRDTEGNPLNVRSTYYIMPTVGVTGGFKLKLRPDQNQSPSTCPQFVYSSPVGTDRGIPVKFTPSDPTETFITSSIDTLISFAAKDMTCPKTWSLTLDSGLVFVTTGVNVKRVEQTRSTYLNALFKINPIGGNIYSISYSPSQSGFPLGGTLSLFDEAGDKWLGLRVNGDVLSFLVQFVKVESEYEIM